MTHANPANGLAHRPEIDGLRALAVLPVMLFHAGFPGVSGGFVGVDVFFVISGYLITGIILAEISGGRFSTLSFYERRARRLLPALSVVTAATVPLAWLLLLPADMVDFGDSLSAVATFSSNILFWRESDYFASDAALKPLLHTWSLAVEEQFYLLFPPFLLLFSRFRRHVLAWTLVGIFFASLALATWGATNKPTPAFYLLPTRAWELLAGGLLALWQSGTGRTISANVGGWIAAGGLTAILYAIFRFDASTPVPGLPMLVPTLGTVAVLAGTTTASPVRSLLSLRPVVLLGLVSYSAYLWHQPLFALASYRWPIGRPVGLMIALLALTVALAWLTWKFVEQPWRDRQRFSRQTVFACAGTSLSLFLAAGLLIGQAGGFPGRLSGPVLALVEETARHEALRDDGGCGQNRDDTKPAACVRGADVPPTMALIGDSHAASLAPVLETLLAAQGRSFVQYTKLGCPFGMGIDSTEGFRCNQFWENVLSDLENRNITHYLVAARWTYYLHDRGFDNGRGGIEFHDGKHYSVAGMPFDAPRELRAQALLAGYRTAIRRLDGRGREVFVVLPLPEQGWDVPSLLARREGLHAETVPADDAIPALPRTLWLARHGEVLAAFREFESHPRIHLHDPTGALCPLDGGRSCPAILDGSLLYYDDDHPSISGARRVLEPLLARALPALPAAPQGQLSARW